MSSSTFKGILVPTLLTSSAVFYGLFTILNPVKPQSFVDAPTLPTERLQYLSSREVKSSAIYTVGFCILGSVAAGLSVAEIVRKQYATRQAIQSKKQAAFLHPLEHAPKTQVASSTELLVELEAAPDITSSLQTDLSGETCRIRVPLLQRTLFGLCLNGEYYSLVKAETHREKALRTIARLLDRGDRAIVTHTSNKYVVWLWQPHAIRKD